MIGLRTKDNPFPVFLNEQGQEIKENVDYSILKDREMRSSFTRNFLRAFPPGIWAEATLIGRHPTTEIYNAMFKNIEETLTPGYVDALIEMFENYNANPDSLLYSEIFLEAYDLPDDRRSRMDASATGGKIRIDIPSRQMLMNIVHHLSNVIMSVIFGLLNDATTLDEKTNRMIHSITDKQIYSLLVQLIRFCKHLIFLEKINHNVHFAEPINETEVNGENMFKDFTVESTLVDPSPHIFPSQIGKLYHLIVRCIYVYPSYLGFETDRVKEAFISDEMNFYAIEKLLILYSNEVPNYRITFDELFNNEFGRISGMVSIQGSWPRCTSYIREHFEFRSIQEKTPVHMLTFYRDSYQKYLEEKGLYTDNVGYFFSHVSEKFISSIGNFFMELLFRFLKGAVPIRFDILNSCIEAFSGILSDEMSGINSNDLEAAIRINTTLAQRQQGKKQVREVVEERQVTPTKTVKVYSYYPLQNEPIKLYLKSPDRESFWNKGKNATSIDADNWMMSLMALEIKPYNPPTQMENGVNYFFPSAKKKRKSTSLGEQSSILEDKEIQEISTPARAFNVNLPETVAPGPPSTIRSQQSQVQYQEPILSEGDVKPRLVSPRLQRIGLHAPGEEKRDESSGEIETPSKRLEFPTNAPTTVAPPRKRIQFKSPLETATTSPESQQLGSAYSLFREPEEEEELSHVKTPQTQQKGLVQIAPNYPASTSASVKEVSKTFEPEERKKQLQTFINQFISMVQNTEGEEYPELNAAFQKLRLPAKVIHDEVKHFLTPPLEGGRAEGHDVLVDAIGAYLSNNAKFQELLLDMMRNGAVRREIIKLLTENKEFMAELMAFLLSGQGMGQIAAALAGNLDFVKNMSAVLKTLIEELLANLKVKTENLPKPGIDQWINDAVNNKVQELTAQIERIAEMRHDMDEARRRAEQDAAEARRLQQAELDAAEARRLREAEQAEARRLLEAERAAAEARRLREVEQAATETRRLLEAEQAEARRLREVEQTELGPNVKVKIENLPKPGIDQWINEGVNNKVQELTAQIERIAEMRHDMDEARRRAELDAAEARRFQQAEQEAVETRRLLEAERAAAEARRFQQAELDAAEARRLLEAERAAEARITALIQEELNRRPRPLTMTGMLPIIDDEVRAQMEVVRPPIARNLVDTGVGTTENAPINVPAPPPENRRLLLPSILATRIDELEINTVPGLLARLTTLETTLANQLLNLKNIIDDNLKRLDEQHDEEMEEFTGAVDIQIERLQISINRALAELPVSIINRILQELPGFLRDELTEQFKEDLINKLILELKDQLLNELPALIKDELIQKLKISLKTELKLELIELLKGEIIEELKAEIPSLLKAELKEELKLELKNELTVELSQSLKQDLKVELSVLFKADLDPLNAKINALETRIRDLENKPAIGTDDLERMLKELLDNVDASSITMELIKIYRELSFLNDEYHKRKETLDAIRQRVYRAMYLQNPARNGHLYFGTYDRFLEQIIVTLRATAPYNKHFVDALDQITNDVQLRNIQLPGRELDLHKEWVKLKKEYEGAIEYIIITQVQLAHDVFSLVNSKIDEMKNTTFRLLSENYGEVIEEVIIQLKQRLQHDPTIDVATWSQVLTNALSEKTNSRYIALETELKDLQRRLITKNNEIQALMEELHPTDQGPPEEEEEEPY